MDNIYVTSWHLLSLISTIRIQIHITKTVSAKQYGMKMFILSISPTVIYNKLWKPASFITIPSQSLSPIDSKEPMCLFLPFPAVFSFYTSPLFVSPLCITIFERYWNWGYLITVQIVLYMERCWKAKRYCESDDPWQMKCQPKWLSANICQIIQHTAGRAHNSNNNNFRTWVNCVIKTSQELRMLSSVTIICQITKVVMNSGSQFSQNCNQCLKCHKS